MRKASHILPLCFEEASLERAGKQILWPLSLCIEDGPPSLLLGPNGAGKSMLLRLSHGLVEPSSGRVRWLGPQGDKPELHQAMVLQRPVLLRRSTEENVEYPLRIRGVERGERTRRVCEALAATGLSALADRSARQLSVGEQQRLALARAWALSPEVLFLDEPTTSLDPAAAFQVEETIRAIASQGTKVVMSTHDLAQARRLAGEVLFLHHGRVLEQSDAKRFFEAPQTDEARAFLSGSLSW